jgi:hypothetical protein
MVYRFLRGINEIYGVTVLFVFIALFLIALAFTVIYPLVPIVLMISSIFLVVFVRLVYLGLKAAELMLARESLGMGQCPACSTKCDALRVGERRVLECPRCRRGYQESGELYVPQEVPEDEGKPATFERAGEAA